MILSIANAKKYQRLYAIIGYVNGYAANYVQRRNTRYFFIVIKLKVNDKTINLIK